MVSRSRISPTTNHFRRLPQRRAQSMSVTGRIAVQLALMNCRAFVAMQEFDWIFDGDDVVILFAIDAIEEHGQSGRLARPSGVR
jgi:hypothetical protein